MDSQAVSTPRALPHSCTNGFITSSAGSSNAPKVTLPDSFAPLPPLAAACVGAAAPPDAAVGAAAAAVVGAVAGAEVAAAAGALVGAAAAGALVAAPPELA